MATAHSRPRNPVPRGRQGFPPSPSAGDTFHHPDTGLAYRYSGKRSLWYRAPALDRTIATPDAIAPEAEMDEPSTAISDLKSDAGPRVLQLFDERPHPALPDGVLARYPLSDLSDEAIAKIADAVLAGLPAALARARMQP
jgi:hypothetical protein